METRVASNRSLGRADGDSGGQVGSESVTSVGAVTATSDQGTINLENVTGVIESNSTAETVGDTVIGREGSAADARCDVGASSVTIDHGSGEDNVAVDSNVALEIAVRTAVESRIDTGVGVATARVDGSVDRSTAVSESHGVARSGRVASVEGR
jgi:hypothetical protein